MAGHRQRSLWIAAASIVLVWLMAWAGFTIARHSRMTAEKVNQYLQSLDLAKLSSEERARALHKLIDKINSLSPEERRRWQFDNDFFSQLTDEEKAMFIDAILPGQMKQALTMFEQMPKEQRQKQIDDALQEIKSRPNRGRRRNPDGSTNRPFLSPELEAKVRTTGLKSLYGNSSAQTKAELAPLMLEIQRQMENGKLGPINGF